VSLSFDRVADEYDATRGGEARGAHIARDIEPHLAGGGLVLEVGAGTGVVGMALRQLGRDVLGIDLSPAMLRHALPRLGHRVAVADAACLPFEDGAFADAFAVWVMHAVADPAPVLAEVARVLRPGGRFVVCSSDSPDPDAVTEIVGRLVAGLGRDEADRRAPEMLARLAAGRGFRSLGIARGAPATSPESPLDVADAMARRTSSWLWSVSDEQWHALVEPAMASLRALGPGPVQRVTRQRMLVLERARSA
jgi:ubiquinone/menaquinone biosynthesis C-methylase UbiE